MLRFLVTNPREHQEFEHPDGPIEFGRGGQRGDVPRCTIQDMYVSKDHVLVRELDAGHIHVENLSQRNSIRLADNHVIAIGETRDLELPAYLVVGETHLQVQHVPEEDEGALQTIASPLKSDMRSVARNSLHDLGRSPTPETLTHWFETVIAVQRAAAGSAEFYHETAKAVVSLVGLDRGLVVLRRPGSSANPGPGQVKWVVQARFPDEDTPNSSRLRGPGGREFSRTILDKVEAEKRTFFQSAASMANPTDSLQGVEAVVASPIFDSHDEVVGAVYGTRNRFTAHAGFGIGPLEAQVMQLLAAAVGVGLARQEHEAEASRLRVQFEQFFSADLARELQNNPRMLEGQEREVTVLFCDIRGFSRLSQKLGPHETCRLVSDVMEHITARVRDHDGVVVDYAGDGVMAVWNAPFTQVDHAARACRAGLAMLAELPPLDASWRPCLGAPLRLGIGINTGPALCGNVGSKLKFKYGPLGHAVNLGSRVEGATKQLGVPLLITGSTREQLGPTFASRRLCRARLAGIEEVVELYELHSESAPEEWIQRRDAYEQGLAAYEEGNWSECCRAIYPLLLHQSEHDLPSLNLIGLAIKALQVPPTGFDGVIDLSASK
jgi:adenylate cyclase